MKRSSGGRPAAGDAGLAPARRRRAEVQRGARAPDERHGLLLTSESVRRVTCRDERVEDAHRDEGQPLLPDRGGVAAEGAECDDEHAPRDPVVVHPRVQRVVAELRRAAGEGPAEPLQRGDDEGDAHIPQQREHAQSLRQRADQEDALLQHPGGQRRARTHRLALLWVFSTAT